MDIITFCLSHLISKLYFKTSSINKNVKNSVEKNHKNNVNIQNEVLKAYLNGQILYKGLFLNLFPKQKNSNIFKLK